MYRKRKRAFTLVELLVVIAIIGILASVLLPALSAARKTALAVICKTNLSNIGKGLLIYTTANSGYFPPAFKGKWDSDQQSWRHWDYNLDNWAFGHARSAHQALGEDLEAPRWPEAWDENYCSMTLTQEELNAQVGGSGDQRLTARDYGILNCPVDTERSYPAFSYGVNCYVCYNDFDTVEVYTVRYDNIDQEPYGPVGSPVSYQTVDVIADPVRSMYMADAYFPPIWTPTEGEVPDSGGKLVYLKAGKYVTPGFWERWGAWGWAGRMAPARDVMWFNDLYGQLNEDMIPTDENLGGRLDFRHPSNTCNILFLDGHVRDFRAGDERLLRRVGYHEVYCDPDYTGNRLDWSNPPPLDVVCRGVLTGLDSDVQENIWHSYAWSWGSQSDPYRHAFDPYHLNPLGLRNGTELWKINEVQGRGVGTWGKPYGWVY